MSISIIESSVVAKSGDMDTCEDLIFVDENFVAVMDGATDKTGWRKNGLSGGQVAVQAIKGALASIDGSADARAFVDAASREIAIAADGAPLDGPSASLAVFSASRHEIWQVGDVSFWTGDNHQEPTRKAIDTVAAGVRSSVLQTYLADGASMVDLLREDPGREVILPLLQRQYLLRNREIEWGYGSLDGAKVPDQFLVIERVSSEVNEICLYSDGYPEAYGSLAEAEGSLELLLQTDPLCMKQLLGTKGVKPGNVSFDDRAYVRFNVM